MFFDYDKMRIYPSNSNLGVLIFTGIGGSFDGYKGKYSIIAKNLVEKYGANVFIVSVEGWNVFDVLFDNVMEMVNSYFQNLNILSYDIYAVGVSAGATLIVSKAYKFKSIKKVLSINPVIQVNFNQFIDGLERTFAKIFIVFGNKDPSFKFASLLSKYESDMVKIEIIKNVDHYFSQHFDVFVDLPEKYLFKN